MQLTSLTKALWANPSAPTHSWKEFLYFLATGRLIYPWVDKKLDKTLKTEWCKQIYFKLFFTANVFVIIYTIVKCHSLHYFNCLILIVQYYCFKDLNQKVNSFEFCIYTVAIFWATKTFIKEICFIIIFICYFLYLP